MGQRTDIAFAVHRIAGALASARLNEDLLPFTPWRFLTQSLLCRQANQPDGGCLLHRGFLVLGCQQCRMAWVEFGEVAKTQITAPRIDLMTKFEPLHERSDLRPHLAPDEAWAMVQDAPKLIGSDLYIEWIRIIDVDLNEYLFVMQW